MFCLFSFDFTYLSAIRNHWFLFSIKPLSDRSMFVCSVFVFTFVSVSKKNPYIIIQLKAFFYVINLQFPALVLSFICCWICCFVGVDVDLNSKSET